MFETKMMNMRGMVPARMLFVSSVKSIVSEEKYMTHHAITPVIKKRSAMLKLGALCSATIFPNVVEDHQLAAVKNA